MFEFNLIYFFNKLKVKKKENEDEGLSFFLVTNSYIGGKFNLLPQVRNKEQLVV